MDRISALRNVEDALADFEAGEADLEATERRVLTVLRTYATEFEEETLSAYRASGAPSVEGLVVVAESPAQARRRVRELTATEPEAGSDDEDGDWGAFEVEPVE
ncbi:DUF7854 family protein [Halorussus marinus]|uniref:DUF7854 family protein n=1 Tax=Halorussus marinus TaxID=2505976 RepID=UPI00106EF3F8|nr:hypothetical protein [Halorussus marinus]